MIKAKNETPQFLEKAKLYRRTERRSEVIVKVACTIFTSNAGSQYRCRRACRQTNRQGPLIECPQLKMSIEKEWKRGWEGTNGAVENERIGKSVLDEREKRQC